MHRLLSSIIILTAIIFTSVTMKPTTSAEIFVFTKTNGFRHSSIPEGTNALCQLARQNNWTITVSEDSTQFSFKNLKKYDAVIFLNTTGNILGEKEQAAFEKYIRRGGAYVGIHSASDTEHDWDFYKKMVAAQFASHPKVQEVTLNVHKDCRHPSIAHLGKRWNITDEWYNFREPVPDYVTVLLDIDESTIEGKKMDAYHPIAWYHTYEGGRCFYTGLGHTEKIYTNPDYLKHLQEGIEWAVGN